MQGQQEQNLTEEKKNSIEIAKTVDLAYMDAKVPFLIENPSSKAPELNDDDKKALFEGKELTKGDGIKITPISEAGKFKLTISKQEN